MNKISEFYYKGLDQNNDFVEDFRTAISEDFLKNELKREGIKPLKIKKINSFSFRNFKNIIPGFQIVSEQEKIILIKNLGSMLEAGLTLSRALSVLENQIKSPTLKSIIASLNQEIAGGKPLSVAMSGFSRIFPPLITSMIQSGEESGKLPSSLSAVGEQMEKSYLLKKKIRGAMAYPSVILGFMLLIGVFMIAFIVPTLSQTFIELEIELPAITSSIISFSDLVVENWQTISLLFLLAVISIYFLKKTSPVKKFFDCLFLNLPVISPIVIEVNTARTTRTLASLLAAGVPFVRSIEIVEEVVQNSYYKNVLRKAQKNTQLGLPISKVFRDSEKYYPPFVSEMMVVGEETGELDKMLVKTANFYEKEVEQKTQNISTIIEPVLMIVVGIAVGIFAFSMIMPMYSLVETI